MTPQEFKRIRTERLRMTQTELAKALRLTITSVQEYEYGNTPISGPVAIIMELYDEGVI